LFIISSKPQLSATFFENFVIVHNFIKTTTLLICFCVTSSPLSDQQQLILQASMMHYPHLGVFPSSGGGGSSLYPGLAAAAAGAVQFPSASDYFGSPGLASMTIPSKFPDISAAANWLGLDG